MDGDTLIGREAELARVRACLDRAATGHGRCVVLEGEPGIGKTSLAREMLGDARRAGFATLVGRCFAQHAGLPFFPFTELLTQAWETAPAGLDLNPPERWADMGWIISDMLPAPPQSGEDTQQRIRRAVTDFLRAYAAERPLVIFIDDLHWADSATLDLVLYLGRHLDNAPVLLLGSYRDVEVGPHHPLEDMLRELVRERVLDEILLRRLPLEGTAALVPARLGSPVLSNDFVELVHARTEGNPLFIEEMLKALIEDGTLVQAEAGWQCKALGDIQVPRSIRSVVSQRVGRLASGTQALLHLASVLGQEFELDVLLAATDQPEAEVLDHVDAALAARLLVERRGGQIEQYAFAHALIGQTLYEELPTHRLRRLHLRAGDALETLRAARADQWPELARHFLLAGQVERAARYALQAAEHAAELYAHAEAVHYYQMVLEVAHEDADGRRAAELQRKLAAELTELNQPTEALACYQAALASYQRIGDTINQAEVHREIAWVYQAHQTFDMQAALPHLDAALRLWPTDREDATLARLLLDAVRAKIFSSMPDEAAGLAAHAMALAQELEDPALLARALVEDALVQAVTGLPDADIVAELNRAEELAASSAPKLLHRLYWNRGLARHRSGDLKGARIDYQRGIDCARAVRQPGTVAWQSAVHASMLLFQVGDWAAARTLALEAHAADPNQTMHNEVIPWADGAHERALELMRASADDARRRDHVPGLIDSLSTLANALLQLEWLPEAEAAAREAIDLVRRLGQRGPAAEAFPPAAEVLVRIGATDAADVLLEAEQLAEQLAQPLAWPGLLRARAILAWQAGDGSAARAALQSSAAMARTQGALIQLGRTLAVLSDVARALGDLALLQTVETERAALIERIGPHVQRLPWAAGVVPAPRAGARPETASDGALGVLTRREREVAALVTRGLSDRQIADALIITEGTAGIHVGHILNKLGFRSRAQVAAWATEHDLFRAGQRPR